METSATGGTDERATTWTRVPRQVAGPITMPVNPTPTVRGATYRVRPDLPGVEEPGKVSDPPGREGVGVLFPGTDRTPLGSTRQRLVADPSTGAMPGGRHVLIAPSARFRAAGPDAGTAPDHRGGRPG